MKTCDKWAKYSRAEWHTLAERPIYFANESDNRLINSIVNTVTPETIITTNSNIKMRNAHKLTRLMARLAKFKRQKIAAKRTSR